MRTLRFDSGETWDNPNARWADPSYVLEPGDPGYVPPASPANQPPTKRSKRVKHNNYYPIRIGDQVIWLENYRLKLPGYATVLSLSAGQVTGAVADAGWVIYLLQSWLSAVRAYSLAATDVVTEALNGDGTKLMELPVFTAPALPAGVVAVNTGALDRIFALNQLIKELPGYTEAVGSDLGLVGAVKGRPDLTTLAPVLKAIRVAAGVQIGWSWNGHAAFLDMIELQVDRADGKGWVMLAFDTTPPSYTDTAPAPATLTKWKYRGIYRVGDQQVGQWSNEVSVPIGG